MQNAIDQPQRKYIKQKQKQKQKTKTNKAVIATYCCKQPLYQWKMIYQAKKMFTASTAKQKNM